MTTARVASPRAVSLCGIAVRADRVRLLASKLGDDQLAQKLERAVANDNTIVALDRDERQRIVDVLDVHPQHLPDLRSALVLQLKRLNDRERQQRSVSLNREAARRRREGAL